MLARAAADACRVVVRTCEGMLAGRLASAGAEPVSRPTRRLERRAQQAEQLVARGDAQALADARHVVLHGLGRDEQLLADLLVGQPRQDEPADLQLALAEAGDAGRPARASSGAGHRRDGLRRGLLVRAAAGSRRAARARGVQARSSTRRSAASGRPPARRGGRPPSPARPPCSRRATATVRRRRRPRPASTSHQAAAAAASTAATGRGARRSPAPRRASGVDARGRRRARRRAAERPVQRRGPEPGPAQRGRAARRPPRGAAASTACSPSRAAATAQLAELGQRRTGRRDARRARPGPGPGVGQRGTVVRPAGEAERERGGQQLVAWFERLLGRVDAVQRPAGPGRARPRAIATQPCSRRCPVCAARPP